MRTIERTTQFKKDYKREAKGRHRAALSSDLARIVEQLANDRRLAASYRDHALGGEWNDHRDLHLKPDLVLIYRKPDRQTLQLVRIGSHAKLGLCAPVGLSWVLTVSI